MVLARRTAEQGGVEEAFEAGAPIDEFAFGELHRGDDDPPAPDAALDEQAAG